MAETNQERRDQFIRGLRELADFYEDHPGLEAPSCTETMNVFVDTKDEIAAVARMATWEKCYTDSWFSLRKQFGPVALEINTSRSTVCKRVVTGTRRIEATPERIVEEYEWVCDEPLLS
jgi:hypothetical protein